MNTESTNNSSSQVWKPMILGAVLAIPLTVVGWQGVSGYRGRGLDLFAAPIPSRADVASAASMVNVDAGAESDELYESLASQSETMSAEQAMELFAAKDPLWKALLETVKSGRPVEVLSAIYNYQERRPKNPFEFKLKEFQVGALDRIWWERIAQLLEEKKGDISPKRAEAIDQELRDMYYEGDEVPRVRDKRQIDRLRVDRNEVAYAAWKQRWLRSMELYARLPWEIGESAE